MTTDRTIQTERLDSKGFTLSRDPDKAMQEMMSTIDALRNIYMEENDALGASDTRRFLDLQDRKITAARQYQQGAEQIIARREEFTETPVAVKARLEEMQRDFSEIASVNLGALNKLRKSVRRMNDRIIHLARETVRNEGVNYGKNGNINKNDRRLSIGLNESA